jgi:hypothetical protein
MAARSSLAVTLEPTTLLRVGIGLVFVYAGALSLADSATFTGSIPSWLSAALDAESVVSVHGVVSLALGSLLLLDRWVSIAAIIATLDFACILAVCGINESTFALFGLMFASLALLSLVYRNTGHAGDA